MLRRHQLSPSVHQPLLEQGLAVTFRISDTFLSLGIFALSRDSQEKQSIDLPPYKLPNKNHGILPRLLCEDAHQPYRDSASLDCGSPFPVSVIVLSPMAGARPSSPAGSTMCFALRINFGWRQRALGQFLR